MISQFLIFKPSGLVIFNYQPGKNFVSIVDSFIQDVLVSRRKFVATAGTEDSVDDDEEENATKQSEKAFENFDNDDRIQVGTYTHSNHILKYLTSTTGKNKAYFVMIYPTLVSMEKPYEFLRSIQILWENTNDEKKFEQFFKLKAGSIKTNTVQVKEETDKSNQSKSGTLDTKILKEERKKNKKRKNSKKGSKKSRKWNVDGSVLEEEEEDSGDMNLDFSAKSGNGTKSSSNLSQMIGDKAEFGTRTSTGEFLFKDLSNEMNDILTEHQSSNKSNTTKPVESLGTKSFGFLKNIIGGKRIEKADIAKVKTALSKQLIKKNVAPNVANSLLTEIEHELVGSTTKSFTSVEETAKSSLKKQLVKLLTPNSSINLLNEIQKKKAESDDPYVISIVGVNGVGKSTNLSKLAYWFLQNNYRVLLTACDTFRSGAVEQLRTHVNNLSKLSPDKNQIELFEGGYGGSNLVAKIAKGAIAYAKENKFDIVLLDTAGRRHNDARLMTPLASFARAAHPDKIIMVGEALVGTDSVMQAKDFDKAFGANRHLDFFIISKCDTVGDMIGSMVNMVFATGIPILFVGTGQMYTDLRTLSVDWAVDTLLS